MIIPQVNASEQSTLTIITNYGTTVIDGGLLTDNGQKYLPLTDICEALGSVVCKNNADGSLFIISRDGDIITHTPSTNSVVLNGSEFSASYSSLPDEVHDAFVPADMIEHIFGLTVIYDEPGAFIYRTLYSNYYHNLIGKLLNYCLADDFYPENFIRYYKYYSNNPTMDPGAVICRVNIGLDKKFHDDASLITTPDTSNVLVNKFHRLPDNYTPENLVSVEIPYASGRSHMLDFEAYGQYKEMYNAAEKEGVYPKIISSYRTENYQHNLYNSYVRRYGANYAQKYSARPGYSEHQTGLAVDINSLYTSFENSKEYAWLKNNAHKFGFIERYPKNKEFITGYAYEPWHYRYVGVDAATAIHQQNITYEEYHAAYLYNSPYSLDKDRTWENVVLKFYR